MSKLPSLAALLAVCLAGSSLAGCAAWNHATIARANLGGSELPARMQDTADGNYKGTVILVASQSPACPGSSFGKIEIGDQRLHLAYRPDTIFVAPIQSDGRLHAISNGAVLDGYILDGRLRFTVKTPICELHYDMRHVL